MEDAYGPVAAYYDREYSSYREDFPLYEHFAKRLDSPFLEVGCGTGRITKHLLELGLRGVGIDPSPAMLELARDRLGPWLVTGQAELAVAGVPAMKGVPKGPFGWAIFGLSVFGHLTSTEQQVNALHAVADRLVSGGLVVIDMPEPFSSYPFDAPTAPQVHWIDGTPPVMKLVHRVPIFFEQGEDVTVLYEEWEAGGAVRRVSTRFRFRYLFPGEAELLARVLGLSLAAVYGGYDLEPFGPGSDRLILVLRKP